jgi:phosphatidylglycerophosphatase A
MRRLAASCFGLGWLPVAPGTWGSLPPVIIFALMCRFGAPGMAVLVVMAALALAGSFICVKCAPSAIAATGEADPREVVADEFAGQSVTFLAVPLLFAEGLSSGQVWAATLVGFALFRFFDIVKPWPARRLEKLPGGWGVLADDLMAGLYASLGLLLCLQTGLLGRLGELFSFEGGALNAPKAAILGALQGLTLGPFKA